MTDEVTTVQTLKDVQVREVKGGFTVVLVKRHVKSDGTIQGIQEDTVASSPAEVLERISEFFHL